jgi:hypothetical protein
MAAKCRKFEIMSDNFHVEEIYKMYSVQRDKSLGLSEGLRKILNVWNKATLNTKTDMTDIHERRDTYSFRQIQTPYSNEYPA